VLAQDYINIEIIVVDDNSPDDTEFIVNQIIKEDSRVSYYKNSENNGACYCRNFAIEKSSGFFLTGLDDDDYFESTRISGFINYWSSSDKGFLALYSNRLVIQKFSENLITLPKKSYVRDLYIANTVGNQIFIESSKLKSISGYDLNLKSWQDLELWINLLSNNETDYFENVNSNTYYLDKSHPHERISSSNINKHIESCEYIINKHDITRQNVYSLRCQVYMYELSKYKLSFLFKEALMTLHLKTVLRIFKRIILKKRGNV
jgi:glycosyltransferase involved in cell wall biosynthesis